MTARGAMGFGGKHLLASTMFLVSCFLSSPYDDRKYAQITNNSEHNITRAVFVSTHTGKAVTDEKDDELIAKNGGSKVFNIGVFDDYRSDEVTNFIACIEAEDVLEPICTITLKTEPHTDIKSIIWNGENSSGWLPIVILPNCPKVFTQCNLEAKND